MSLKGTTNEEKIWNYLIGKGLSVYGAAGLMGNLYAESGLRPNNLQNSFEKKLGMTDVEYTKAVDNGTYTNFEKDGAGYGLAQWTFWTRKRNVHDFAVHARKSIGDLEMQLDFLCKELSEGYKSVLSALVSAKSIREASDAVLLKYERPADQSVFVQEKRAKFGQSYYDKFVKKSELGGSNMTEKQLRDKKVSIMRGWIGCKESDGSHKKIIDLYNKHKPLPRGYAVKYTDAWCATTDSAATIAAGLTNIIPIECSCSKIIELAKKMGIWVENDAYVPEPGDSVLYDWDDNGAGDCTGNPEHIGVVEEVKNGKIIVIEGNKNNAVGRRELAINGRYIRGFIAPDYASKATEKEEAPVPAPTPGTKDVTTVAKEVINGKWGNGVDRVNRLKIAGYNPDAVQKEVNRILKGGSSAPAKKSVEEIAKEVVAGRWGNGTDRKKKLEAAGYNYTQVQAAVNRLMKK